MTATIDDVLVGTLGDINIGLSAGTAALNPLAAQLDAVIAFGLGPVQSDLPASLDAAIGLQATLALTLSDPTANIRKAIQALIELLASLQAALALPPTVLNIGVELGASAALSAALSAKLGAINQLLNAAIAIKIPAQRLAADLVASLNTGGMVLLSFDGLSDPTTLQQIGNLISTKFSGGVGLGAIAPTDPVAGIIMVTSAPSAFAALGAIIAT